MKNVFLALGGLLMASSAVPATPVDKPEACWLETSAAEMPASMAGAGLTKTKTWSSTVSAVLVRERNGDVLIDTGFSPTAETQMSELPAAAQAFGDQIVSGAKNRTSIVDGLATVGELPARVARILITHGHYDHLGGATQLAAPIYIAAAEAVWLADQAANPTITPPSLVESVKPRLKIIAFDSGSYLGFPQSKDLYGDGVIVVVPLPGHTPGSQGVFLSLGRRRVFLIGDASDILEAAERGLPKSASIRANTDFNPELADRTAKRVSEFHRAHPEIALIPAHDRLAYTEVFGAPSTCVSSFHPHQQGN